MPRQEKIDKVEELRERLERSRIAVFTDYRGITASDMGQLRHSLQARDIDFHVVKNSLTRIALDKLGVGEAGSLLQGPTAIAFGRDDELIPTQAIVDYIKTSRGPLRVKGGLQKDRVLSPAEVQFLASLSSREKVIAQALGVMASPLRNLVYLLASPVRGLLTVLQGRKQRLEGGSYA